VDIAPLGGLLHFDVTNVTVTEVPNRSDDTIDTDTDAIPDDCDDCPQDVDNDIDADAVCGEVDNCPATPNPFQSDWNGNGIGDACDAEAGAAPVPGLQPWGLLALVMLLAAGSFIVIERRLSERGA